MNCPECHDWLQRRLDGEALDAEVLERHLAACPACREVHLAAQRLLDGLRLLPCPAPPAGLTGRITGRVLADRRRVRRLRLVTATALAASVLLAVFAISRGKRAPAPAVTDSGTVAVRDVSPPRDVPSLSLQQQMGEAGQAMAALTRRATNETVYQTRLFLPDMPLPAPDAAKAEPLQAEMTERSLREVRQGVTAGVEPVANSARRAMRMFLRELPPAGPDRKSKS